MEYQYDVITDFQSFYSLESDWCALASQEQYQRNPFIDYYFNKSWIETYVDNNAANRLIIVVARKNGCLVGITPMVEMSKPFHIKFIEFIGTGNADYADCLVKTGEEGSLPGMIHIQEGLQRLLVLRNISEDSIILKLLRGRNRGQFTKVIESSSSPYIQFSEQNWDQYPLNLPKDLIDDIQYNIRRLIKMGTLEYFVCGSDQEKQTALESLSEMHKRQWGAKGQISVFYNKQRLLFYRRLIQNMKGSTMVHISGLKFNKSFIALHCGFENRECFFYYKPAYDLSFAKYSPGKLLISFLIEDSLKKGKVLFDFLRGVEQYKEKWTNMSRKLYIGYLTANNFWVNSLANLYIQLRTKNG